MQVLGAELDPLRPATNEIIIAAVSLLVLLAFVVGLTVLIVRARRRR